ncbi:hypothetical protein Q3H58_002367 [Pseudomonas psychrotolerans]|nr:hypothetical protein [Pseudomonas psychrotolerans]
MFCGTPGQRTATNDHGQGAGKGLRALQSLAPLQARGAWQAQGRRYVSSISHPDHRHLREPNAYHLEILLAPRRRRSAGATARPGRPAHPCLAVLRPLRRGGGGPDPGTPARCGDRPDRRGPGGPAGALGAVQPGATGHARLPRPPGGAALGPGGLRQQHRLADLQCLHVRPGLREDRPRPPHRPATGQGHWVAGP